jgi:WD40 repeat protein/tRNA A-37 threonylcarbamoyl transferase component Bud32
LEFVCLGILVVGVWFLEGKSMVPSEASNPEPADPTLRGHSDESVPNLESERGLSALPVFPPPDSGSDATISYLSSENQGKSKPSPSVPQRSFGDYELLQIVAHGGMGVVYKARQIKLQRIVALKMIRSGDWASGEEVQRFYEEAEAVAQLDHPGIVPIYEVGQYEGQHYFSMGFMEGGSLTRLLKEGPLPPRKAAELGQGIADAVSYAHERGIVHRDLKPGNVLLDRDGRPKVSDFGLAKRVQGTSNLTVTGQVLGTPNYMPPEQATGKTDKVGPLSDVYSIGAVLYCLLTGRPPFQAASPIETLQQVIEREPVPPRELNPGVDYDLETICLKCLQKEPSKRYGSAQKLGEDLCRFLAGEPIEARRVGPGERLVRWGRRKPALAAAVLFAAVLLLAITVISTWFGIYHVQKSKQLSAALTDSQRQSAMLMLERGLGLCEQHDEALGMTWLAHSLKNVPTEDEALRRMLRLNLANWQGQIHPLRAVFPLGSEPWCVAFSPDGKWFVTGHPDNYVRLWETATGQPVWSFKEHKATVWAVAFSPDGNTILSGGDDNTVRFWQAATGQLAREPLHTEQRVRSIAFCRNGKTFMVAEDRKAQLYSAQSGQPEGEPVRPKSPMAVAAVNSDGTKILTAAMDGTAHLWSTSTGKQIVSLKSHAEAIWGAAFSPDGKRVMTGSWDRTAQISNADTGEPITLLQHGYRIGSVAFSPDGKIALTRGQDNIVRLWDVASGRQRGSVLHHLKGGRAAAFHPKENIVLTCDGDNAKLWQLNTDSPERLTLERPPAVKIASFSKDGSILLTVSEARTGNIWQPIRGGVGRLWSALSGRQLGKELKPLSAAALSPDAKMVLTGDEHGKICFWDAATGEPLGPSSSHPSPIIGQGEGEPHPVRQVLYSPDGKVAVTVIANQAQLWDANTRKPLGQPLSLSESILAVAFDRAGSIVFAGGTRGAAQLWDVPSGNPHGPPLKNPDNVLSVAFSPDNNHLVTGCYNGGAQLCNMNNLNEPVTLRDQGEVWAVAFSPDGRLVLTGSSDGTGRLWDVNLGQPFGPPLQHGANINQVAFSPEGRLAATASSDWTARVWDVATGKPIGPPLQHQRAVWQVVFSPDGQSVLTGSEDGTACIWKLQPPLEMEPERLTLWLSVITGLEMDDAGNVRGLDALTWQQHRRRLEQSIKGE